MQVKQSQKSDAESNLKRQPQFFRRLGVGDSWGYGFNCYKLSLAIFYFLIKRRKKKIHLFFPDEFAPFYWTNTLEDFLQYCVRHLKTDIANIPIENVIDEHKKDKKCRKGSQHYFADLQHAEGNLIFYNIKHRTFCIMALFHFEHD